MHTASRLRLWQQLGWFALISLCVLSPTEAQTTRTSALTTRLAELITTAGLGDEVSVTVIDAATSAPVFSFHGELPLNPASNQKLVTAAAALAQLGAERRFRTGLYGRVEGDAVVGGLVLKGFGDPSLHMSDIVELARDLARRGVRRVDEIVVDATYFDGQFLPPAFDQRPREFATFRAATGAVSIDGNAYQLRVRPGEAIGEAAVVTLDGSGYFDIDNQITTSESGGANIIHDQRADGERLHLTLRGSIPVGSSQVAYPKRIENPTPWSGHVLRDALRDVGIRVQGGVRIATTATDAPLLASHASRPLSEIVTALGKQSDNFVAEMLFRNLGAERRRPGRVEDSLAAVHDFLDAAHIDRTGMETVNGSGLYRGNLVTSGQLANVLGYAFQSPGIRNEYVAHLAIGGVDGTLEHRLTDLPAPRIVRAKTGTLDNAIGLSGYVLGREPGRAYAFSVIANGISGRQSQARALCDDIARALAADLWH